MKKKIIIVIICMANFLYSKDPLIVAHRGASGYEPENTVRAFKKALDMGVPMIELDVHLSKSGDIMVIHDETTPDKKKVKELTTQELQKYHVGKGERIPLLTEVLDLIDQRTILNIELKAPGTEKAVAQLLNHYIKEKKWNPKKFIVASFDHHRIREFQKLIPSIPTGVIFEGNPIELARIATQAHAQYAIMYFQWITPEFIKDAHGRGVKVYAYTVNEKEEALKLKAMNIDGIITNYPDLLIKPS